MTVRVHVGAEGKRALHTAQSDGDVRSSVQGVL